MSRRLLQLVNGLMGLATVGLGAMQISFGVNSPVYASADLPVVAVLDSNLRFFAGMALGLGLLLLWLVPTIERQTVLFRAVWACAFLGGVGRLISLAVVGAPSTLLVVFTVIEVAGVPLLIYWQHLVAQASTRGPTAGGTSLT